MRKAIKKVHLMARRFWENSPAVGNRGRCDTAMVLRGIEVIARRFGVDPEVLRTRTY